MSIEYCAGIRILFEPTCSHCIDELSDLMSDWCDRNGVEWDTIDRLRNMECKEHAMAIRVGDADLQESLDLGDPKPDPQVETDGVSQDSYIK